MKKCTGENCPMQMGYDFENCAAIEKCPYRTWPVTPDEALNRFAGVSDLPETLEEIKKWLETPWEGKP